MQKSYFKFIMHVMLLFHEEFVERHENKVNIDSDKANNVKDGIRAGPIA